MFYYTHDKQLNLLFSYSDFFMLYFVLFKCTNTIFFMQTYTKFFLNGHFKVASHKLLTVKRF